jgi:hypothetical protein
VPSVDCGANLFCRVPPYSLLFSPLACLCQFILAALVSAWLVLTWSCWRGLILTGLDIYLDEPTNEYTQDETVDEIVSPTED